MDKIYLDNGSTSFPKAPGVGQAMADFIEKVGVNIGRGGYEEAYSAAEVVLDTREKLCGLLGFDKPENVIFTSGVTASMNILLKGLLRPGDHVLTTSMEHNAVMRPLRQLEQQGVEVTCIPCERDGSLRLEALPGLFRPNTRALVMTGLFAALGCVATMVLQVPSPTGGYMNLGDTVVILGAYLLGPLYGAVAGGVGPALADLLSGYAVYVPGTLVIKALMALTAALLYRALGKKNWAMVVCGAAAEAIMVVGYCLYDGVLSGSLAAGAAGIPSNLTQAAFGLVVSTLLAMALKKNGYVRSQFPQL